MGVVGYTVENGVAVLTLDAPNLNAISYAVLDELRAAVARACSDPAVRGIVITGGPTHFSSGVDIHLFRSIQTADDAIGLCRTFQQGFQGIEDSPKPVVAAVAGSVLGGALELAMACHYRVAARDARFAMPEVTLGFNPGAGGTQRLPRLVGVPAALMLLLSAEMISADVAHVLGLIDEVCGSEELIDKARRIASSAAGPRKTSQLQEHLGDQAAIADAFQKCEQVVGQSPPELIGPAKIIETVKTGVEASFAEGIEREQMAFAECMESPAARNRVYLFFASRETRKIPELEGIMPRPIARTAVVGMGTMGSGIVQALAEAKLPVVVLDQDEAALRRGIERIRTSVEKRVADGKLAPEQRDDLLARITPTTEWSELSVADVVIEAVYEDPEVKQAVLASLETVCLPETVLASNTSAIPLGVLAAPMRHPERLVGMHFFHPAQRMPLVEIARRRETDPQAVAVAMELAKTLRKVPVLVNDCSGFLVDRLFVPYLKEAFHLLEEGAEPGAIDAAMVAFGFPKGPLALIDMAGLDILECSDRLMGPAYPRHGRLSTVAARLVQGRQLGQKTGGGVYRYEPGDRTPRPSPEAQAIIAAVQQEQGLSPRRIAEDEITDRLVFRMVGEAFWALEEGVARCEADIDVATVLGIGFPNYRGGVVRYARGAGLDYTLHRLETLYARFGERFLPCQLLRTRGASYGAGDRTQRL